MTLVTIRNESWSTYSEKINDQWNVSLRGGSAIQNCSIRGHLCIDKMSCVNRCTIQGNNGVGCFSYIADTVIGRYSTIASRVSCGAFNHPTDWLSISEFQYRDVGYAYEENRWFLADHSLGVSQTVIGHDSWICDNAVVLSGIGIGIGAIVGAGAVVTKHVPPYAIVCGNPARIIRYRFSSDIIEQLLSSKWWELDISDLSGLQLDYRDIRECMQAIQSLRDRINANTH